MAPVSESSDFYSGSRLLTPWASASGLSIDQVNFLTCQVVALLLGFPFRWFLNPRTVSSTLRHVTELVLGVALVLFCFGSQWLHLLALATLGYMLIQFIGRPWMPVVVLTLAMAYLSVCHIYRMILDYGGYTLDITGPLMIAVQKITSVAYALHDGTQRQEKDLTPNQKSKAIKKMPGLLEFYSFIFSFHGVMCGPTVFYHDYISFIDGTSYSRPPGDTDLRVPPKIPSPVEAVFKKLIVTIILGALMMSEPYVAYWDVLKKDDFLYNWSWAYRMIYLLCSMSMHRPMYYFAWKFGELVNNSCGLGFSGYDEDGKPKWNLLNNVEIYKLEFSNSLKVNVESWNVLTTHWLRHVVYERVNPSIGTWLVFMVSAFWHGFYPGYYIAFLTAALFTTAARLVRRNVRPYFIECYQRQLFYDGVTFVFTRLANSIMVVPFVVLDIKHSLLLYTSLYWWLHILSALAIVYFKFIHKEKPRQPREQSQQQLQPPELPKQH